MVSFNEYIGPWFWLAAGLLLLGLELLGAGGVLLSVGIAALITAAISALVTLTWQIQFVVFGVLAVIITYVYWKFVRPNNTQSEDPLLNNKMARLVGSKTALVRAVQAGTGKVQIHDALWTVSCDEDLEMGALVEITGYEGATLIVKPV